MARFQSTVIVSSSRTYQTTEVTTHFTNVLGPTYHQCKVFQSPVGYRNSSELSGWLNPYRSLYPCSGYIYVVFNGRPYGDRMVYHCGSLEEALGYLAHCVNVSPSFYRIGTTF